MRVIPRPFFDRPLWTDPLWWFGIGGGLISGIIYGLRADLGSGDFAWQLLTGVFFFTWWIAGLLMSTIRFRYRGRQAFRLTHQASDVPSKGSSEPPTRPEH